MNLILLLVVVVAAGAVLSVQAAINGRLGQTVGVLRGSLVTFVVGAIVTALLILFFEPAQSVSLLQVPKWQLTGALFGVVYMMVMVGAVPIVGTAVLFLHWGKALPRLHWQPSWRRGDLRSPCWKAAPIWAANWPSCVAGGCCMKFACMAAR